MSRGFASATLLVDPKDCTGKDDFCLVFVRFIVFWGMDATSEGVHAPIANLELQKYT